MLSDWLGKEAWDPMTTMSRSPHQAVPHGARRMKLGSEARISPTYFARLCVVDVWATPCLRITEAWLGPGLPGREVPR
jgi:hypothetical protein